MTDKSSGTGDIRGQNAAYTLFAGAGGALLVSSFLALAGLALSAGGLPDMLPQARSVLNTFAWMFLYYLAAALPLGLLAAFAARLFLSRPSLANILTIVITALLAITALLNALVSTGTSVPHAALSLLNNAIIGIAAAFGTGAIISWLKNQRLGPWLLKAAVILVPLAVILLALNIELHKYVSSLNTRKIAGALLLLAGGVVALLLAAIFSRISSAARRICSALFALACAGLVIVSLAFGDRPVTKRDSGRDTGKAALVTSASSASPNVILISIDTLRADGLSCYGNPHRTSPAIDGVAAKGVRFQRVYSTSSWTLPAHASMFTGLYTASHGADKTLDQSGGTVADALPAGIPTLAETLRNRGYRTAGFISNPWVSSVFGLGRGFDEYDDHTNKLGSFINVKDSLICRAFLAAGIWSEQDFDGSRKVDDFLPAAMDWITKHSRDRFFLFLHLIEPHYIYEPPEKYRLNPSGKPIPIFRDIKNLISGDYSLSPANLAGLQTLYEGEIKYIDERLSGLFALLDRTGLTGHTLLIITSDHGESFGEHGLWTHGNSLYEEQVHVPLIMRLPGAIPEARIIDNQLGSLVDLMPSILDIIGAPPAKGVQGRSLRPAWEGNGGEPPRAVYAELRPDASWRRTNGSLGRGQKMIRTMDAKYLEGSDGQKKLFLTREDPREDQNVVDKQPALAQTLELALHAWQAGTTPISKPNRLKLSPEMINQMRALGYIH
jgi:arylsulfatase A-like enzyme